MGGGFYTLRSQIDGTKLHMYMYTLYKGENTYLFNLKFVLRCLLVIFHQTKPNWVDDSQRDRCEQVDVANIVKRTVRH